MICYVLAMGKQHLGPHVVVGHGIKIFWPGFFITSPDHLECIHVPRAYDPSGLRQESRALGATILKEQRK